MTVDDILADVLRNEGGYVNDPRDRGGETNWGVTIEVARANGYSGSMRDMPKAVALEIYRGRYVVAPGFGKVANISPLIAAELVDTGVNMGPPVASRFLQRALNGLTQAALVVDGALGQKSIDALAQFKRTRGDDGIARLLALLNAQQGTRYLELAEGRTENRAFLFGWLKRIMA